MRKRDNMSVLISNIQRMCFHDGPGIRTTVFLKGCGIHCPWCANPENLSFEKQYYYDVEKCRKSEETCIYNKNCAVLKQEKEFGISDVLSSDRQCPLQAFRQCGREYETDELIRILEKDAGFWGDDGGVTFSGGEPLLQASELVPVWENLKEKKVHMAIETSLFVPKASVKKALDYINFYYIDIKLLDKEMCKQILGGDVEIYFYNVQLLTEQNKKIYFRIPCSEEYVLKSRNWNAICKFLEKYSNYPVQIFGVHNLGESKYRHLGMKAEKLQAVSDERMNEAKCELEKIGIEVEIINI